MTSVFNLHFDHKQNSFVIPVGTWLNIITFWCFVTVVAGMHCYFYDKWLGSENISVAQSLLWSAIRWLGWIAITPIIIQFVYRMTKKHNLFSNLLSFFILLTSYSVSISLLYTYVDSVSLVAAQSSLAFFYRTLIRELPISFAVLASITVLLRYYFLSLIPAKRSDANNLDNQLCKANKVEKNAGTNKPVSILISGHNGTTSVPFSEIIYLMAAGNYVEIHTVDKKYVQRITLKKISEQLSTPFLRVHRSYIVNREHIDVIKSAKHGGYNLTLSNGDAIAISRHFAQEIRRYLDGTIKNILVV